jgi:hypothetical protein
MQDVHPSLERTEKAPGVPELIRWHAPFRVWHYSRWLSSSWTLFSDRRPVSGDRALVRRVTLTRSRFDGVVEEKLEARDFPISPEAACTYAAKFSRITLAPFIGNRVMYLDASAYGIESAADRVFFEWQEDGPEAWDCLVSAVRAVIAEFESFDNQPNQPPLQTPASGTPAANAPVAPPPGAAGL